MEGGMGVVSGIRHAAGNAVHALERASDAVVDEVEDTVAKRGVVGTVSMGASLLGGAMILTGVGAPVGGALVAVGAGLALTRDVPRLIDNPHSFGNWAAVGLDALGLAGGVTTALAPLAAARAGGAAVQSGGVVSRLAATPLGSAAQHLSNANAWALSRPVLSLPGRTLSAGHVIGGAGVGFAGRNVVTTGIRVAQGKADPLEVAGALVSLAYVATAVHGAVQSHHHAEEQAAQRGAAEGHDDWREPRRIEGTDRFEPRPKTTTDQAWIKANGTNQVDIANTPYDELPVDWQAEGLASNRIATRAVGDAQRAGRPLDAKFVETTASDIHDAWLERNGQWAPPEQKLPYSQLSAAEQAKDRIYVERARDAMSR
jgi:hypothetical protein